MLLASSEIPGLPPRVRLTTPNSSVTGLSILMVAAAVCEPEKPRASHTPPLGGRAAMQALIFAPASLPKKLGARNTVEPSAEACPAETSAKIVRQTDATEV